MKGSDLDLTIVKGAAAPRAPLTGPACAYINLQLKLNNKEQGIFRLIIRLTELYITFGRGPTIGAPQGSIGLDLNSGFVYLNCQYRCVMEHSITRGQLHFIKFGV